MVTISATFVTASDARPLAFRDPFARGAQGGV
jgi:hypothetical protein